MSSKSMTPSIRAGVLTAVWIDEGKSSAAGAEPGPGRTLLAAAMLYRAGVVSFHYF